MNCCSESQFRDQRVALLRRGSRTDTSSARRLFQETDTPRTQAGDIKMTLARRAGIIACKRDGVSQSGRVATLVNELALSTLCRQ